MKRKDTKNGADSTDHRESAAAKRRIVLLEPKKWRGTTKKIFFLALCSGRVPLPQFQIRCGATGNKCVESFTSGFYTTIMPLREQEQLTFRQRMKLNYTLTISHLLIIYSTHIRPSRILQSAACLHLMAGESFHNNTAKFLCGLLHFSHFSDRTTFECKASAVNYTRQDIKHIAEK